jgi:homoserine O-acetyltransferase
MSFAATAVQQFPHPIAASTVEIVGPANGPAILALGGISADRHLCRNDANRTPGWWEGMVGPSAAIDTLRYRVVGADFLGPRPWAFSSEPRAESRDLLTTHDQAGAIAAALDDAGINTLHAVVGASYGGMVALAFAELFPERVARLVVIGAAHRSSAITSARRLIQRRIVELGISTGRPREALALARELALTTYRSDAELEARFGSGATTDLGSLDSWLRHHGEKFTRRFSVERYLTLSLSSDLHEVDPTRITTPATLIALQGDAIVPFAHLQELARQLRGPARLIELATLHGHDAFLTDTATLAPILRDALEARIS